MFHKVLRAVYGATSKLLELQLRGAGDQADDDSAEPSDRVVLQQPYGLAVLPKIDDPRASTVEAEVPEDGGEPRATSAWDKARTPTDLEAGETRLYAVGAITNVLRLLVNAVVIQAATIKLGANATKKVNREGDPIRPGSLTVAANATTLTITYTAPDGGGSSSASIGIAGGAMAPAAFVSGTTTLTLGGKTGAGSSKVLAED